MLRVSECARGRQGTRCVLVVVCVRERCVPNVCDFVCCERARAYALCVCIDVCVCAHGVCVCVSVTGGGR